MYDSLHGKLMKLPDDTLVYPAHGAGSSCGKNLSKDTVSTIGAQRAHNYALRPMTRDAFVRMATHALPDAPAYFAYDATLNRKQRPTLDDSLEDALEPLSLDDLLRLQREGSLVLDVRDPAEFEPAHLAGSVNIGLGGRFASWVGTLLDPTQSVALIANPGREREAALRLGRVGFDAVAGYLDGGFDAVRERAELVRSVERWGADDFERAIASRESPLVLDVRNPGEWNDAHIRGSVLIPLAQLESRMAELPRDKKIAVHCASGYRSSIATSLLERGGFARLADLAGGIQAWQSAKKPTQSASSA
jgi:rhodanese-related sulfurtransferase